MLPRLFMHLGADLKGHRVALRITAEEFWDIRFAIRVLDQLEAVFADGAIEMV